MKFWDDPSGDRLRAWLGVSRDVFYNSGMIAILPMDFYYPGKEDPVIFHRVKTLPQNGTPSY